MNRQQTLYILINTPGMCWGKQRLKTGVPPLKSVLLLNQYIQAVSGALLQKSSLLLFAFLVSPSLLREPLYGSIEQKRKSIQLLKKLIWYLPNSLPKNLIDEIKIKQHVYQLGYSVYFFFSWAEEFLICL